MHQRHQTVDRMQSVRTALRVLFQKAFWKSVPDFQTIRVKTAMPTTKPAIPPESLPPASNQAMALKNPPFGFHILSSESRRIVRNPSTFVICTGIRIRHWTLELQES